MTSKPFYTWHDRDELELGGLYVTDGDTTVEFAGIVAASLLKRMLERDDRYAEEVNADDPNEPVLVFSDPEHGGLEWHTRQDTKIGRVLIPFSEAAIEECLDE